MATKDKGGAASKEEREEFGMGEGAQEKAQTPERSTNVHDAGTGSQKVDKTGTPDAAPQWPASQPNRSGK